MTDTKILDAFCDSNPFKIIKSDITRKSLHHAYAFTGNKADLEGFARLMLSMIYCVEEDVPCLKCIGCNRALNRTNSDIFCYPLNGVKVLTEDITDIIEKSQYTASEGGTKVFLIDKAETMTPQAQNKLLKNLEEPSKDVVFILLTTSVSNMLPTVLSRVKMLRLNTENSIIDQQNEFLDLAFSLLFNVRSSPDVLGFSGKVVKLKQDFGLLLKNLSNIMVWIMGCKSGAGNALPNNRLNDIIKLSEEFSVEACVQINELIILTAKKLNANVNITAAADGLMLGILEVKSKCR